MYYFTHRECVMLHPEGTRQLRSLSFPKQRSFAPAAASAQDDRHSGHFILL
jgi:hypothetical protein